MVNIKIVVFCPPVIDDVIQKEWLKNNQHVTVQDNT